MADANLIAPRVEKEQSGSHLKITTTRLIGERIRPHHLPVLMQMDRDPRIMNRIGGVRTEEETRAYLEKNLEHWAQNGFGLWMLSRRADHQFVGRAALRRMELGGSNENVIGYALLPDFWGMGLATEIVAAILDLAFHRLGMADAVAGALPDNMASRRVMEKTGGVYERDTLHKDAPHVLYRFKPGPNT